MTKRINPDEIDESFIIASVKKDPVRVPENAAKLLSPLPASNPEETKSPSQETPLSSESSKEETRSKRGKQQEYEALFIKESNLPPARFGKTVYIRKEYHDKISQIIHVVGGNEVSLFGYIDNVLAHHFESFQEGIAQSFKKNIMF